MDIEGLGDKHIEQFVDDGLIKDVADFSAHLSSFNKSSFLR